MTTLTLPSAIAAADAAAGLIWERCDGPSAFGWRHALAFGAPTLAQFLLIRREASAEQLYGFAVAGETAPAAWRDLPPPLRVAIEVFRATFLVLLREVEWERSLRVQAFEVHAPPLPPGVAARIIPLGRPECGPRASAAMRQSSLVRKGKPT